MSTPPVAPTSMSAPADDDSFSGQIKKATWSEHNDTAGMGYMHRLFRGELDVDQYAAMVIQHYPVYVALEDAAAAWVGDPVAGDFVRPELNRTAALEADLEGLLGADWRAKTVASPATEAYVARIREVCATSATAFVAHHYTRYLGDLSGGQMIGRIVTKNYGFGDGPGARFYVFDDIEDPKAYKELYRERLDALPLDEAGREATIAEILKAYELNGAVIAELDAL